MCVYWLQAMVIANIILFPDIAQTQEKPSPIKSVASPGVCGGFQCTDRTGPVNSICPFPKYAYRPRGVSLHMRKG